MSIIFDGKKIRDEILSKLKEEIAQHTEKPKLAVLWVGDNFASEKYINAKRKAAENIGMDFELFKFSPNIGQDIMLAQIKKLNEDDSVSGILIQLPIPETMDMKKVIESVAIEKDVDGLRFCSDLVCSVNPPVILSILLALEKSEIVLDKSKVAVVGQGFLVGSPITKILKDMVLELRIADRSQPYLGTIIADCDAIISATGKANIIKPEMIKDGVVLIDAGTTEMNGEIAGDIDPDSYAKASFYTPVPGGIGPVTVAMLLSNVFQAFLIQKYKTK